MEKEFISTICIIITIYAYFPYIRSINRGETRPHVFSWIIWGIATLVVFGAQLSDHGGVGAWPMGLNGVVTLYVAWLAYVKRADSHITQVDWIFFVLALASLPLWYITSNPLWAVVLLTIVDTLGFAPTFRKSYSHPFEERLEFYLLMTIRNFISVAALENYSYTTILFPALTGAVGVIFIVMVIWRRQKL